MFRTARVEGCGTSWAGILGSQVLADRQLMSARAAQDRFFGKFFARPDDCLMFLRRCMTIITRKPQPAALELDRDDIERRMPVCASRLSIYVEAVHFDPVDNSHE